MRAQVLLRGGARLRLVRSAGSRIRSSRERRVRQRPDEAEAAAAIKASLEAQTKAAEVATETEKGAETREKELRASLDIERERTAKLCDTVRGLRMRLAALTGAKG